jgi:hypothetical protein
MGRKIFVSYKYADNRVLQLNPGSIFNTTVRNYVTILQGNLRDGDHINQGEADGESLANFKDTTIESKLKDKIYYSSCTIVMISPGMKNPFEHENDQWIPWEVSYSLRNQSRQGRVSGANALLAVVLPDVNGSYDYFMEGSDCGSINYKTDTVFKILGENMFNLKNKDIRRCSCGEIHEYGEFSYIPAVRWYEFLPNIEHWLEKSYETNRRFDDYKVLKTPNPGVLNGTY